MPHSCRNMLCDTPHYEDECECNICDKCHANHDLTDWECMPDCPYCIDELEDWA